jgi:hypothetical protein
MRDHVPVHRRREDEGGGGDERDLAPVERRGELAVGGHVGER